LSLLPGLSAVAAEYRVEVLKDPPPKEGISADTAARLQASGLRIIRGTKSIYCDLWLCKDVAITSDFKPSAEVLYPFHQGQLIGVVRYRRSGTDFRDQDIRKGTYTLRYALQPVDGNHEGTSPTRDFLLLLRAKKDESPGDMDDEDKLNELSSEAAESSHPALLPLQKIAGEAKAVPSMRHDKERDWWIVRFRVKGKAGDTPKDLDVELVVVGQAEE
jgi:hypothetical protein